MSDAAEDAGPTALDFEPESHTYRVDGLVVPSVTQLLDDAGLTPDYKFISRQVLAHARARGIHVDACCDLLDEGDLDWASVHPEAVPYVEAWACFCADYGYEPAAGQVPLYHPQYGYAGTADSIGTLNGSWVVVERKATTKMAATYGLQTAGYAQPGLWVAPRGGGRLEPVNWHAPARLGVQLKRDGSYVVVPYEDSEDLAAFLGVVALYRWRALSRHVARR
ncbi:MAG TPA: hypothetical protein VLK79_16585 [Gaiellales bacterium]|nr:hypothetical protein [Gaiellales bacterium]